jgi:hypothetical protein
MAKRTRFVVESVAVSQRAVMFSGAHVSGMQYERHSHGATDALSFRGQVSAEKMHQA